MWAMFNNEKIMHQMKPSHFKQNKNRINQNIVERAKFLNKVLKIEDIKLRWSFWHLTIQPHLRWQSFACRTFFSLVLHTDHEICYRLSLNTIYQGTTFNEAPGPFNSSQMNMCIVGISVKGPQFTFFSQRTRAVQTCWNKDDLNPGLLFLRSINALDIQLKLLSWNASRPNNI